MDSPQKPTRLRTIETTSGLYARAMVKLAGFRVASHVEIPKSTMFGGIRYQRRIRLIRDVAINPPAELESDKAGCPNS